MCFIAIQKQRSARPTGGSLICSLRLLSWLASASGHPQCLDSDAKRKTKSGQAPKIFFRKSAPMLSVRIMQCYMLEQCKDMLLSHTLDITHYMQTAVNKQQN